jgi:hypothetical protein
MLREAMLEHPELIPVIVRKGELGMGAQMMDSSAARLVEEGVPIGAVVPLLDALELFALGSAIHETRGSDSHASEPGNETNTLTRATKERLLSAEEIYDIVSDAVVVAVESAAESRQSSRRRPARAAKKAPAERAPAKRAATKPTRSKAATAKATPTAKAVPARGRPAMARKAANAVPKVAKATPRAKPAAKPRVKVASS